MTESTSIRQFSHASPFGARRFGRNFSLLMRGSSLATCLALAAAAGLIATGPAAAADLNWDAGNNTGNGSVEGGGGIWDASTTNWTKNGGNTNIDWDAGSVAVFGGAGGDVAVTGVQVIDGLVFTGNGYKLLAANPASRLELDDSSANLTVANAADTATISAAITGLGGVVVNGSGTLSLTGVNTYTGVTSITGGGTLDNSGAIAGAVAVNSGKLTNSGTIAGLVTNKGALVSTGALNGGLTNSGSSTADIRGAAGGPIDNQGNSLLKITGNLDVGGNTLTNKDTAKVVVEAGATTGISTLTNRSKAVTGVEILAGASLTAGKIINEDDATIHNKGTLTAIDVIENDAGAKIVNNGTLTATNGIQNDGTLNNSDNGIINANIANSGTLQNATNGGVINGNINNSGIVVSGGVINGNVSNTNDFLSSGTINGSLTNSGAANARLSGAVNGPVLNQNASVLRILGSLGLGNNTLTNTGTATIVVEAGKTDKISTLKNSSSADDGITVMSGAVLEANKVENDAGAEIVNLGTLNAAGGIQNEGTLNNSDGGNIFGDIDNSGTLFNATNGGVINGAIVNTGLLVSGGTLNGNLTNGTLTGSGVASISGVTKGAILNQNNSSLSIVADLDASGQTLTNTGTSAVLVSAGATIGISTLTNSSTAEKGVEIKRGASLSATDILNEAGATIVNGGTLTAAMDFKNSGTLNSTGTLNGNLTNLNAGAANLSGALNGAFSNQDVATLTIDGALTGVTTLTNSSTALKGVEIKAGASLTAANVVNEAGASILNGGILTATAGVDNRGLLTSTGTLNGAVTNSGTTLSSGEVNGDVNNTGAFTSTGTLNGSLTNGSLTVAAGASVSGVINGPVLNQSSSLLNVIGDLDASGSTVTNTGTAKFAVTAGATTGISALTNSSTAADGVTVATGASLTAASINNGAGASILSDGTVNAAIANLGNLANNGSVNGLLTMGAGGTLSGTGNLSGLLLNGGILVAGSAQTVSGDMTQNAGAVLGSIIGPGSGQYLMNGGSIGGSVTKYGTFVQTGGDLAAGSNISVDAFGSTGGTDSGATITARLRAAASGGQILALTAQESLIINDSGGISFVSDAATPLGAAGKTAVTTTTTAAGPTSITVNGGITGLRGISASALGTGAMHIVTRGPIDTASTAIAMQTAGGAGVADIYGNVTVSSADAAFAARGNSTFNIANGVTVKAATFLNSSSGLTIVNNAGALETGALSAGGAGNIVFNNQTAGAVTLGGVSLSNFNGANDAFNNNGVLNASGSVTLAGLENFTNQNSGSISLGNGAGGDRLSLGGNLDLGASRIFLDVDLSDPFSGSRNDMIQIGGILSGSGAVFNLNNIGAGGLSAFFEDLTIIDAAGVAAGSSFEVAGIANAGLFSYGLFEKSGNLNLRSEVKADVAGGIVSNFITAQNTVSNAFFKPTSSFVSTPLNPEPNQVGFAPWFRTSGGLSRVGSEGVALLPTGAPQDVFSKVSVGYGGYQFGLDGGLFNLGDKGGNIHVGLTAGQIFGTADQINYNNKTSMTDTFVGGYGIYSNGPFFVDAQLRQEFIGYTVNVDDFLFKVDNAKVEAKRFSAGISGGYAFKLNEWSIVPAAGYTYGLSKTGDLHIEPNTLLQQSASTVTFGDSQSHIAFGGLSVARSYLLFDDRVRLSPFLSLTAYHDFGQENEAQLTIMTAPTTIIDVSSKSGATYGEVSLGANFLALTPEFGGAERLLTGNLRGDVQFGKDRLAGSLNLQLRLQF